MADAMSHLIKDDCEPKPVVAKARVSERDMTSKTNFMLRIVNGLIQDICAVTVVLASATT